MVRAGAPLRFPTQTVKASTILPDLDKYQGAPIEFGRMEPTASDPSVQQQFGMIVGIPNAGQVNAIGTLNIRGERSVTCKGEFDKHPSLGPLPPGAPPVCEYFRQQSDALERAAELDAQYGRNPDLKKLPMYGVVFSFKDPFDTKDMRSTGGGDARYDMDFPARDHLLVEQLRNKGAIIFAKAVNTEYNGRAGDPGGRNTPDKVLPSTLGYQRSTWAGNPSNPYDTTRSASLGSSSGSALSVSVNMVMASLGEETRASCRGPSNHNAVALILPHKSMIGFDGGAIGADIYCDRTGIHARKIQDCAKILDALKDDDVGYYDPRDVFSTVPRSSVLSTSYEMHARMPGVPNALAGVRLGVIRESMVYPKGSKTEQPIVDAATKEIKDVLGGRLGVTLVESSDPLWQRDPEVEQMKVDYRVALARLVPVFMPDLLFRLKARRHAAVQGVRRGDHTDRVPAGQSVRLRERCRRSITAWRWRKAVSSRRSISILERSSSRNCPTRSVSTFRNICRVGPTTGRPRASPNLSPTGLSLNARSKFWGDDQRAAFKNWEEVTDPRNPLSGRQGVNERIMLRELLRRADMMVILENKLDALVRLHTPWPPGLIGHAYQYDIASNLRPESLSGPNAGLTEVLIPAGYVTTAYDPVYKLTPDGKKYVSQASDKPTKLAEPGLPFSLVFRCEPGKEDIVLRIASAYEAASQRRIPPPAFGALA